MASRLTWNRRGKYTCIQCGREIWDKCEESCRKVVVLVSRKVVDTCNSSLLAPMEDIIKTTFSRILRSRTEQTWRRSLLVLPGWRNSSLALTSKCESARNGDARSRVCPPSPPSKVTRARLNYLLHSLRPSLSSTVWNLKFKKKQRGRKEE